MFALKVSSGGKVEGEHVEGENKVCGRTYPRFWQGPLSTPICESGLRSVAKHNISSILSQWQANIIEQRIFFRLMPCSVAASPESAPLKTETETDGSKIGKEKQSERDKTARE